MKKFEDPIEDAMKAAAPLAKEAAEGFVEGFWGQTLGEKIIASVIGILGAIATAYLFWS